MQNYNYEGFYQFPTNVRGLYRFAIVSDLVITGPNNYLPHLGYFLARAKDSGATEVIYLNRAALSHDAAERWPSTGLTTWCLRPPAPNNHDREDLVPAPPGFILSGRGVFRPVHLHYRQRRLQLGANGIHLVGGVSEHGYAELPSGGVVVKCGCFTIVELQLDRSGNLIHESTFWKPHKSGDVQVTEDV